MKCFYHREQDAVGMCKSCHKGVCTDCAAEVGGSIACRDKCEDQVAAVDAMVARGMVTVETQKKNRMYMPAFFLVVGLVFLIGAYVRSGSFGVSSIMGVVFIVFGVALLLINRKWMKDMESEI